ncbi:creatininase family protein [Streptomyces sp. NPDC059742]|uniref:creatininase family protein n=1 Tax=Streptomyces sp. NPDC059742 TaxID=3346927 RepID=UPI0036504FD6
MDVAELQPRVAVLPVGSFEQHGRYLPLITDTARGSRNRPGLARPVSPPKLTPLTLSLHPPPPPGPPARRPP